MIDASQSRKESFMSHTSHSREVRSARSPGRERHGGHARRTTAGPDRTIDLDDAAAWARSCRALLRPPVASATPAVAPTSFTNRRLAPGASAGLFRSAANTQKAHSKQACGYTKRPV